MRLSEWSAVAPSPASVAPKVLAVAGSALAALGASSDPECWASWGDDPTVRWMLLVPTPAGLVTAHIRVNVPQEGPRAAAKLVRWSRVQLGEVAVEVQGAHRLLNASIEGVVLRGADAEADALGGFLQAILAAIDGRPLPTPEASPPVPSTDA